MIYYAINGTLTQEIGLVVYNATTVWQSIHSAFIPGQKWQVQSCYKKHIFCCIHGVSGAPRPQIQSVTPAMSDETKHDGDGEMARRSLHCLICADLIHTTSRLKLVNNQIEKLKEPISAEIVCQRLSISYLKMLVICPPKLNLDWNSRFLAGSKLIYLLFLFSA